MMTVRRPHFDPPFSMQSVRGCGRLARGQFRGAPPAPHCSRKLEFYSARAYGDRAPRQGARGAQSDVTHGREGQLLNQAAHFGATGDLNTRMTFNADFRMPQADPAKSVGPQSPAGPSE